MSSIREALESAWKSIEEQQALQSQPKAEEAQVTAEAGETITESEELPAVHPHQIIFHEDFIQEELNKILNAGTFPGSASYKTVDGEVFAPKYYKICRKSMKGFDICFRCPFCLGLSQIPYHCRLWFAVYPFMEKYRYDLAMRELYDLHNKLDFTKEDIENLPSHPLQNISSTSLRLTVKSELTEYIITPCDKFRDNLNLIQIFKDDARRYSGRLLNDEFIRRTILPHFKSYHCNIKQNFLTI